MTRWQISALIAMAALLALTVGSMTVAVAPQQAQPVVQSIADPFCATSDRGVKLSAVTVLKAGRDVSITWRFARELPDRAVLKLDLESEDLKYHWVVMAELDSGFVPRVETIDTVSKQRVGYVPAGSAATARVIGEQVEVTAPLPGAPDVFNWFAGAGAKPVAETSLDAVELTSFCPAGWLATYPAPPT